MSQNFYKYYNDILDKSKHLSLLNNRKKNKIIIQDGILKIDFNLKHRKSLLKCKVCGEWNECDYQKCKHIYYILINHFKLDFVDLFFIWKNNNYNKIFFNEKFDYNSEDCMFCLQKINYFDNQGNINFNNYQCLNCGICSHNKCERHYDKKTCINCKK